MRPGWTAEIMVDADLGKVPNDPIEAAKYAVDQVRRLAHPVVKVEQHTAVETTTWLVDTTDGSITAIGTSGGDLEGSWAERSDETWHDCCYLIIPGAGSSAHHGGLYRLQFSENPDDYTISCGAHLGEMVTDEGAHVSPYDERSTT